MSRCAAVLLVSAVIALPGAELVVRDIRAALLVRSGAFDYRVDSALVDDTGSDAFASGTGLEIGTRYSFARTGAPWGLVVGGDLAADWYTYDDGDGMASYGARACVGLGYALSDRWTTVLEVGGGYGFSSLSLPATVAAEAFEADGDGLFYDARLSVIFVATRRWTVHGHVGWMVTDYALSGSGIDIDIEQSGFFAGLGVTWLFSTKPTGLE